MTNSVAKRRDLNNDKAYSFLRNIRSSQSYVYDTPFDKLISTHINRSLLEIYKKKPINELESTYYQKRKEAMECLLLDLPLFIVDNIYGGSINISKISDIYDVYTNDKKVVIKDLDEVDYNDDLPTNYEYKDNPRNFEEYNVSKGNDLTTTKHYKNMGYSNEYLISIDYGNTDYVKDKDYDIEAYLVNVLEIPFIDNYFREKGKDKELFLRESLNYIEDYIEINYNRYNN